MSYKKILFLLMFSMLFYFSICGKSFAGNYEKGFQAYNNNNYAAARSYFQHEIATNPSNLNARYYLASTLLKENKIQEAMYHLKYIVQISPNSYMGKTCQAAILKYSGKQNASRAIIAMNQVNNSIILNDVKVNSQEAGQYILDTGASFVTIPQRLASQLNLNLSNENRAKVTTANGIVYAPVVTLNSVTVNGLTAYNVKAIVLDIKQSGNIDGLIGLSFLNNFKMTMDNKKKEIILEK